MGDPVGGKGVLEGADHRLLPDQIGKSFRPVFPGEDAVSLWGVGHGRPFGIRVGVRLGVCSGEVNQRGQKASV